jgi:starch phosphorylase
MFGLTADQVIANRGWYKPQWHYDNEPETREALDLIFNNHFSPDERGIFEPIRDTLLTKGDYYMHLADMRAYVETQERVDALYRDRQAWATKAIINVAHSGKFSSDRTILQYANEIWGAKPCPVEDCS